MEGYFDLGFWRIWTTVSVTCKLFRVFFFFSRFCFKKKKKTFFILPNACTYYLRICWGATERSTWAFPLGSAFVMVLILRSCSWNGQHHLALPGWVAGFGLQKKGKGKAGAKKCSKLFFKINGEDYMCLRNDFFKGQANDRERNRGKSSIQLLWQLEFCK